MTEKLLQFIWQFRYFSLHDLVLESGENISIIFPGHPNNNQGPDFLYAKIKIEETMWIGNIELHLQTSQWKKHEHDDDKNYNNVILHVVWENDWSKPERNIPTLVLQHRVSKLLLEKYREWMESPSFIPCKKNIQQVNDMTWTAWKQRLLVERLQRKSLIVQEYLKQNNDHWEETLWWLIAGNFGIKVNVSAFEAVARSIPVQILAKHKNNMHQLEAMLLGQAGLLENNFIDEYPMTLKKEYLFLKGKYHLPVVYQNVHFLRMRPGNFPTIRFSQLAALIHESTHLFSRIKEAKSINEVKKLLSVKPSDYWNDHYVFDERSVLRKKSLGRQTVENIIINTIIPVLYTYGWLHTDEVYQSKAIEWLEGIAPEENAEVEKWRRIKLGPKNSFDSQALYELKTNYCDKKRCLECAIGNALLKKTNVEREF
ncbi:MAG: DUF2851 family protein [Bacteroidetes bacterium]|nr:DUF2851 family protein [Bacteroidota bacterium]